MRRTVTVICLFTHRHIKQLVSDRCGCPWLVTVTALARPLWWQSGSVVCQTPQFVSVVPTVTCYIPDRYQSQVFRSVSRSVSKFSHFLQTSVRSMSCNPRTCSCDINIVLKCGPCAIRHCDGWLHSGLAQVLSRPLSLSAEHNDLGAALPTLGRRLGDGVSWKLNQTLQHS